MGGVLSSRQIQAMAEAGQIRLAAPLAHGQIQPASLDLRLGQHAVLCVSGVAGEGPAMTYCDC